MMYKDKEVSLITKQIFLLYKTEYKMEKIDNTYWGLSNKQIDFIQEQGISMNDLDVLIEEINILLAKKGFDRNYNITQIGSMCESILDRLVDLVYW